jgi:hypothetical protein
MPPPSAYGETPLGLASQILNLAGVLTRRMTLKVPRYQRPYTWTEHEVRQLIQDLWRAFERDATFYFIGQIVMVKNKKREMEISDGQQRLATLTMIIAFVRDRITHRAAHYQGLVMLNENGGRPRLMLREADAGFYRRHVQEPNNMKAMARLEETAIDSQNLMCAAAATIEAELDGIENNKLDAFMSFVVRRATFNVVEADERGAAAGIYNAMNNTGQDLSAADNIKCDLLENSRLSDADADDAARKWEALEIDLGREDFSALINQMPFLLTGAHLISPGDLGAFRTQVEAAGGVREFLVKKLPRYGECLKEILKGEIDLGPASFDVSRRIQIMLQLTETRWMAPALVFLTEHRGNPEQALHFFQALERFVFGCELSVIDNTVREDRFSQALKQVAHEDVYGPGGALDLSDSERSDFVARLNRSAKIDRQRRILMIRIEAALGERKVLSRRGDITVEHVLPANGGPYWDPRFPDRVLRQDAANLLGNLVLLTRRQNQRADNKSYPDKREVYFKSKNAPIHAVTRDIEPIEEWSLDAIETRHEELVRLLGEDWDLVRVGQRH